MPRLTLPLAGPVEPEIPLYAGDDAQLERDVTALARGNLWATVMGGFSRPGKMPGLAWGIPATRCRAGSELAKIDGTVCHACYARKGTYSFDNVQKKVPARRIT